jgi:hypothetical protein
VAQRRECWSGPCLSLGSSLVRRAAAHIVLDRVESGDVIKRVARGGRTRCSMDIEELAADVCPAGDLGDPGTVKPVEPGIAVGMEIAGEVGKMLRGSFALAIGCIAEQGGWRCIAAVTTLVANIGPQPASPGATGTRRKHGHRRIVGV